jgi:hypothetical protein
MPVRRPLALVLSTVSVLAACSGRLERAPRGDETAAAAEAGGSAAEETFSSEAERTRAMEERAAELESSLQQAMEEAATDEERQRAYEEFEQGRLELEEMAESAPADDEGDAYGEPPAP